MTAQRQLSGISKDIKLSRFNLEQNKVKLTDDQEEKLATARTDVLNAADKLHSVASELLGELKREES